LPKVLAKAIEIVCNINDVCWLDGAIMMMMVVVVADSWALDQWVFERVDQLLRDAESDAHLKQRLHAPKVVFFLHLLGLDTAGHAHRPYSKQYVAHRSIR
jgi:hypothetical protein